MLTLLNPIIGVLRVWWKPALAIAGITALLGSGCLYLQNQRDLAFERGAMSERQAAQTEATEGLRREAEAADVARASSPSAMWRCINEGTYDACGVTALSSFVGGLFAVPEEPGTPPHNPGDLPGGDANKDDPMRTEPVIEDEFGWFRDGFMLCVDPSGREHDCGALSENYRTVRRAPELMWPWPNTDFSPHNRPATEVVIYQNAPPRLAWSGVLSLYQSSGIKPGPIWYAVGQLGSAPPEAALRPELKILDGERDQ